jgi:catechol 2,3-dioxygenase-like lactoylglutathione lyase family enzyme
VTGPHQALAGRPLRVHHAAVTVRDLDAAVRLLTKVLGGEVLTRYERHPEPGDRNFSTRMNADSGAWFELAMVRWPSGSMVELFQYHQPGTQLPPCRNSDVGGAHLAIEVEDFDAADAALSAAPGVTRRGTPITLAGGPLDGLRSGFFDVAAGLHLEIVAYPEGARSGGTRP